MEISNKGKQFQYLGNGERRKFRPMADQLFVNDRIEDFPTDHKSLSMIKNDIISFPEYCYERTCSKGYVENIMVEEMHNIAVVLRAYCEVDEGTLWESDFNRFNIEYFEYLLREGLRYDRNLVMKLLTRSDILNALCTFIIQYQEYSFDIDLVLDYFDISVEDKSKNLLCFMTHQLFPRIKSIINIKTEDLTAEELIEGIRSGFFIGRENEVNEQIRKILIKLKNTDGKAYDDFVADILRLNIMEDIKDISLYKDFLKGHDLYMLKYHPDQIDYKTYRIDNFIGIKNIDVLDNVTVYGGYELYKRALWFSRNRRDLRNTFILGNILKNKKFRRIHYEEKLEEKKDKALFN